MTAQSIAEFNEKSIKGLLFRKGIFSYDYGIWCVNALHTFYTENPYFWWL